LVVQLVCCKVWGGRQSIGELSGNGRRRSWRGTLGENADAKNDEDSTRLASLGDGKGRMGEGECRPALIGRKRGLNVLSSTLSDSGTIGEGESNPSLIGCNTGCRGRNGISVLPKADSTTFASTSSSRVRMVAQERSGRSRPIPRPIGISRGRCCFSASALSAVSQIWTEE